MQRRVLSLQGQRRIQDSDEEQAQGVPEASNGAQKHKRRDGGVG